MAFPIKGERQLMRNLEKLSRQFPNATVTALYQETGIIFEMSQQQVPVDNGDLMQSGGVFVFASGGEYRIIISYAAAYALRIHEATEYDANRALPGSVEANSGETSKTTGKSKFLEHPFQERMPGIEGRIAKRVKLLLASGDSLDPRSLPTLSGKRGR